MGSLKNFQEIFNRRFGEIDRKSGDLFLLAVLIEEVGELAESIRRGRGIEEELADVLFMIISIANLKGVDLEEALRKKYVEREPSEVMKSWDDVERGEK
ncbi:MAG: hypothetical protein PWR13_829 [Archaeoglobi archaeon]|nr:hypothetical protein [Archaeoglobi archaeon]MDK2781801.1 hypothetical protein [Archaeoglobi archaeon]